MQTRPFGPLDRTNERQELTRNQMLVNPGGFLGLSRDLGRWSPNTGPSAFDHVVDFVPTGVSKWSSKMEEDIPPIDYHPF